MEIFKKKSSENRGDTNSQEGYFNFSNVTDKDVTNNDVTNKEDILPFRQNDDHGLKK